jgi:hypothetical protein
MTTFDDRERAFESQYARDQDLQFKIAARRNRLLGAWAAELMGLTAVEAEAYAKDVVRADFERSGRRGCDPQGAWRLTSAGVDIEESRIRDALERKWSRRGRQFIERTT